MACTSFIECIYDPVVDVDNDLEAADKFRDLGSTAVFSINLALYLFYAVLIVSVTWFIFKGIYAIIGADSSDSYEKFRGAITNAVFAAIGIALIGSARFFFIVVLKLLGIDNTENIFMDDALFKLLGI